VATAVRAVLGELVGGRVALDEVELALVEICNNVVFHTARTCGEAASLELQIAADADSITLTVLDDCAPRQLPPGPYQLPGSEAEPAEGGYGLFLFHSLFDEVSVAPIDGRNAVRCVKKLEAAA